MTEENKNVKQPTELELALEKAKDIRESAYYGEIRNNLKTLKARAKQIAKDHDFLEFQGSDEDYFALNVEVGKRLNGRIFCSITEREQIYILLKIADLNEKYEIWSEQSSQGYLYTIATVDENPFGINKRNVVNSKLIDYVVTKMIQRIEYHVLKTIPE